jgi:hypothetical protein
VAECRNIWVSASLGVEVACTREESLAGQVGLDCSRLPALGVSDLGEAAAGHDQGASGSGGGDLSAAASALVVASLGLAVRGSRLGDWGAVLDLSGADGQDVWAAMIRNKDLFLEHQTRLEQRKCE